MSIFRNTTLSCPVCDTKVDFKAVHSVNADRRPDLRESILDETFQQQRCPNCDTQFRLDPEFNLLDAQRGQWIAAAPLTQLSDWRNEEQHARDLFDRAYGPESNAVAQDIGKDLKPRVTFGWPALREKLLASEFFLDDVVLEMCKAFVMRNSNSPISADTELRLIGVEAGDLIFGWLTIADESLGPTMRVARTVYDQIAVDESGDWAELKESFNDTLFVDLNRMMIAGYAPKAEATRPKRSRDE
jgi:CpXC protein